MKIKKRIQVFFRCMSLLKQYKSHMLLMYILHFSLMAIIPVLAIISNQQILNGIQTKSALTSICIWLGIYVILNIVGSILNNLFSIYDEKNAGEFGKYIDVISLKKAEKIPLELYEELR